MEWLWLLEHMNRASSSTANLPSDKECVGGFCKTQEMGQEMLKRPSDLGIAMQAAQGDLRGAFLNWAMRQSAPWLQSQLAAGLARLGLSTKLAGSLAAMGVPVLAALAVPWLARALAPRRPRPFDVPHTLNQQQQAMLQSRAQMALNEAVDTAARLARNKISTARNLAGSNQYLAAVTGQAAAPAAAEAAASIITQGLQTKAGLLQEDLRHLRQREADARNFAQQIALAQKQAEEQRRQAMMQMMLAIALQNQGAKTV